MMHVICQRRYSRNILTKALRNIHHHCSTGLMKSEVLHLRQRLQKKYNLSLRILKNLHILPYVDCTYADCKSLLLSVQVICDCTSFPRLDQLISDYIPILQIIFHHRRNPSSILLYTKRDLVFKCFSSLFSLQHFPIPFQGILTDVLPTNCYKV